MQFLLTSSPSISSINRRRPRSTPSRKAKAKVKNQRGKKAKDQKGLQAERQGQTQVKRQRSVDHLVMESNSAESQLGSRSEGSKRVKKQQGKSACSICGKSGHNSNQCWWNRDQEGWSSQGSAQQLKGSSGSQYSKEVYNIHQYPQDQPLQTLPPDQLRGFRDL